MQTSVLLISLLGIGLVAAAFRIVIVRSVPRDDDYSDITRQGYLIRRWWLLFLCAFGVLVTAWTLIPFPLQAGLFGAPRAIDVVGRQWSWDIASRTAQVGESVRFRVTSADVNHGFALYGPDDQILAQTQAMPGYVNELDVTFEKPGRYRVLCLEYCGLAHHGMTADITVTEGP
jgi:cytochrome c oxidase subunit 2